MKMKKLFIGVISLVLCCCLTLTAAAMPLSEGIDSLKTNFASGKGPVTDGYAIDYRYYSPVKENDSGKYPLVVWLHGMWEGSYEGQQVKGNNIAYWTSDEFQSRFAGSGAFIMAPRSIEEKLLYWDDCLIYPLRAAIDDFIAKNPNVDISRIYVGGFSMGGKMTLKMITAYPEMFAAAFPVCPAWTPSAELAESFKDIPVWLTSAENDPLVNYNASVVPCWNNIKAATAVGEHCRFSTMTKAVFPDGSLTESGHHSWFAVNYDMFSFDGTDYPNMTTVNGKGESVVLTYPEGMISWLSQFASDFDGAKAEDSGNIEFEASPLNPVRDFFAGIIGSIFSGFMRIIDKIESLFA